MCGLTSLASANLVLQQFQSGAKVLDAPPTGMHDTVPARVVGHGTAHALAAPTPDGLVLGYEGEGFPERPGFGLLLVEDSLDTFKGVLIYDLDPPTDFPKLGSISSAKLTMPLYGVRVNWGAVSDRKCPLFADPSTR